MSEQALEDLLLAVHMVKDTFSLRFALLSLLVASPFVEKTAKDKIPDSRKYLWKLNLSRVPKPQKFLIVFVTVVRVFMDKEVFREIVGPDGAIIVDDSIMLFSEKVTFSGVNPCLAHDAIEDSSSCYDTLEEEYGCPTTYEKLNKKILEENWGYVFT